MTDISVGKAQQLTSPNPFALLSTVKEDGSINLMAVSWWTYLSNRPPMLGVALSQKGLSGSLIEAGKEFGLSIVGENLKEAALGCGSCSGRSVNKVSAFHIPLEDASVIAPKLAAGSRVAFECKLTDKFTVSDHIFYAAEIVACHGDPEISQLFAWDGYSRLDTL